MSRSKAGTGKTGQVRAGEKKSTDTKVPVKPESPFYIVGIGGSAGGLEAFKEFLRNTPPDSGAAYVIVTHLDPEKESLLTQLLTEATKMKVQKVEDGMTVLPDNVYVIPKGSYLAVQHGRFGLSEMPRYYGTDMPIDHFFKTLAADVKEMAIGVVLSGMGMDGTLGLRAIKNGMGLTMAQDPGTSAYDSMPRNAVDFGVTDVIAPVDELPAKIASYIKGTPKSALSAGGRMPRSSLEKVVVTLKNRTGNDFSSYKPDVLERRISRRMGVNGIATLPEYAVFLEGAPKEVRLLFKDLLIEVTSFFRDPMAFEELKKTLNSAIMKMTGGSLFKAWVPACLTGEEAYSIAMIVDECLEQQNKELKVQIFATDINADALERARLAIYPLSIAGDISPDRLKKYFQNEGDGLKVVKRIRDMVIFAEQNVISDPSFSRLDLVSCRNLLIYLKPEMQEKLMKVFFQSLNPDGVLFLGSSETIGDLSDLYATINGKYRLFRRRPTTARTEMEIFPMRAPRVGVVTPSRREEEMNLSRIAQSILLEQYSPPAVFVDEDGEIMYVSGRIGNYLELAPGKTSTNIFSMAKEAIRYELSSALRKVIEKKKETVVTGLRVMAEGKVQTVDIVVKPIMRTETMGNLFLVMFIEKAAPAQEKPGKAEKAEERAPGRARELELELQYTRQRLQSTVEEMQASREEFTSMNEELQAANEELTASKEEMQSLNEELLTVNSELQAKIADLTRTNSDMKNLLDSTDLATLFLYKDLKVRNFTPAASKLIKLIPTDIGRPITDIASKITSDDIVADAMEVIKTMITMDKQIRTTDGRWYSMRILPYRTVEDVFDGVVITFNDITEVKNYQESLQGAKDYAENIVNTVRDSLLVLNLDMEVISANKSFFKTFKVTPEETMGRTLFAIGQGQWDIPELKRLLEDIIPKQREVYNYIVEHDFPHIGHQVMALNARQIVSPLYKSELVLLAIENVSKSLEVEQKIKQMGGKL